MKNYLCIKNDGVCDYRLFTLLGASTARGDKGKIGQFGSGAKHGALVLMRQNIPPIVMLGKDELTYYTQDIPELKTKQLGVYFKGEKQLQSMVVDFGIMDWQNPHMALREYISNAIDAGGWEVTLVDEVIGVEGQTRVYVPLTPDIVEYYNNLSRYFLHAVGLEESPTIANLTEEKCRVYRKGVLVGALHQTSAYHYNLPDVPLDESRNIKSYEASYHISRYIVEKMDASKVCRTLIHAPKTAFERNITYSHVSFTPERRRELATAWNSNYVLACEGMHKHLEHLAEARNLTITHVGATAFGIFKDALPTLETITKEVVNGVITMAPSPNLQESWNSLWTWLKVRGLTGAWNQVPEIKMFRDEHMKAFVSNGECYLVEEAKISDMLYVLSCLGLYDVKDGVINRMFAEMRESSEL